MSGPKGYSYSVVSEAERARRALEQAQNRCRDLERELAERNRELRAQRQPQVNVTPERVATAEAAAGYEANLRAGLAQAQTALDVALAESAARAIAATLSPGLGAALLANVPSRGAPAVVVNQIHDDDEPARRTATLGAALAAARELAPGPELDAIFQLAGRAEQASADEARAVLHELRVAVNAAVRRQRSARVLRERALETLLGLPEDDAVEALRAQARAVENDEDLERLQHAAAALRAENEAIEDDLYVAEATAAVLADLGYEVEVMDSADVALENAAGPPPPGAVLRARRPDLPEHALQVRLIDSADLLVTSVVATGTTTPEADFAAEELTCRDIPALTHGLAQRGVGATRRFANLAGEVPVARAAEDAAAQGGDGAAANAAKARRDRARARRRRALAERKAPL